MAHPKDSSTRARIDTPPPQSATRTCERRLHVLDLPQGQLEIAVEEQLWHERAGEREAASVGCVRLDTRGRVASIDRASALLLGVRPEEAAGAPLATLLDDERFEALLDDCLAGAAARSLEVSVAARDLQLVCAPLLGPGGSGFHVVLADITSQRTLRVRLRFLAALGEALASSLDYEDTLRALARMAVPTLGQVCVVDLCREDGALQRLDAFFAVPQRLADSARRAAEWRPMPHSPQAQALAAGEPLIFPNGGAGDPLDSLPITSMACVPLRGRNRTHGVITFATLDDAPRLGPSDVSFLLDVARRAGAAIDNAALYELAQKTAERERGARRETEKMRVEATCFYALAEATSRVGTLDAACCASFGPIERLLGCAKVAIACHADDGSIELEIWRDVPEPLRAALSAHPAWSETALRLSPRVFSYLGQDRAWSSLHGLLRAEAIDAMASVPVLYGKQLLGRLVLLRAQSFTSVEVDCARRVARHVAHAIARVRNEREVRRSRRETEQTKALLDSLYSNAPVGLACWNRDLRAVRVNREMTTMTGLRAGHLEDRLGDEIRARVRRVIETNGAIVDEEVCAVPDLPSAGERHWRTCFYPVPSDGERPSGVGAVFVDVTQERRRERRLRALAGATRALATSLESGEKAVLTKVAQNCTDSFASVCLIDVVDDDGQVRHVAASAPDPALAPLLAHLVDTPVTRGAPHLSLAALDARRGVLQACAEAHAQPEEAAILRAARPVSIASAPFIVRGAVVGAIVLLSRPDVAYDSDDLLFAEELSVRAAFAVHNVRLHEAAHAAVEARQNVLALVSHDLRTPLNSILLSTDALLRAVPNDRRMESRRRAEAIKRASERMWDLIGSLLDVSSIEAGRLAIVRRRVPVAPLVADAIEAHETLASRQGLHLFAKVEAGTIELLCDRRRLHQVLTNLLGNAIKFTGAGGTVTLRVTTRAGLACFQVEDTGPGISAEDQKHLFERYWRAKDSAQMGTGLGLSIAKGIVEAHGGRIWVESAPGAGATFAFTIPLAPRD